MKCTKCKKEKTISEFNYKNVALGLRHHQCNECTRLSVKNHYNENRKYYLEKTQRRNKYLRQKANEFLLQYFLKHPCVDCGETDPRVLEFDHKGERPKFRAVSQLIRSQCSLVKVQEEINKCEVRCANCHRRKTAIDFKWFKSKMPL